MSTRVRLFFRKPREGNFSIEGLFDCVLKRLPPEIEVDKWVCPHYSKGLLRRLINTLEARHRQVAVNHITGDVHYLVLGMDPKRTVLTIHDAAVMHRLSGFAKWLYGLLWFRLPMRRVACVTVISEATRRHLCEVFNFPEDRIRIIPDCISEKFVVCRRQFRSERPRLLQIGTKNNKNLDRLAEALSGLDCELRIIGKLTNAQVEVLEYHRINYSAASNLSLDALVDEYINCDILTFVSTVEGFGLPIIEAQSTGRPVVTSNCSSMPEVAGGGACLVNPHDVSSIREGILRVIQDSSYREQIIEEGFVNALKYTPSEVSKQYADLYREVALGNIRH